MGNPVSAWSSPAIRNTWLTVHIVLVLLGLAALLLASIASLVYLFQERELKRKKPHKSYYRLPALGTLDDVISQSMAVGFVLITLAVIAGSTWGFIELKSGWLADPKIVISFVTWGVYMALVFLRTVAGVARAQSRDHDCHRLDFRRPHLGGPRAVGEFTVQVMKLHITGVSHKTAPVEVRERLAFRPETLPAALADLKSREGVSEAVILSTCNRVEITVTTDDQSDPQAIVDSFLADEKHTDAEAINPHLYRHEGRDAIHHLFRVASSLDSMVVGEPQILGQLKTAYATAKDCGSICGWMDGLMTRAFGVAKRVRSETGCGADGGCRSAMPP
ncbi:MAG: cytochrome c biogenesis protein CcsA [Ignavibacteriota bacterium]